MKKRDAAVFILMGQSNAVGYATLMKEEDQIRSPLQNVFGLEREYNLSYDSKELIWTGYTSHGTILGEENDHTCSVANCLARVWQDAIDQGANLPDLHIINIAIGAQGVSAGHMWHPDRKPVLIPGPLGVVNISLCPFAGHIFSLLDDSFRKLGKNYEIIGLHWRGGEEDMTVERSKLEPALMDVYERLFQIFYNQLGQIPPVILHRIVCFERATDCDTTGKYLDNLHYVNSVFQELEEKYPNISIFDVRNCPHYVADVRGNGLFIEDVVHFTPETNQWVAQQILAGYKNR